MSIDGAWKITMQTPMGAQQATADLKAAGEELTGTFSGQQGSTEITDGKISGNDLSWKMEVPTPMGKMKLEATGKLDGDSISGSVKLGAFGTASFTGTRA